MDQVLVEYLNSGQAWVLVGSGPSNQMGYPSWLDLAEIAKSLLVAEGDGPATKRCQEAIDQRDFPAAFGIAESEVGTDRLLEVLRGALNPRQDSGRLYDLIARWPAAVYLTTNYDSELHRRLAGLGLAFELYGNSPDHLSLLNSQFSGGVVRLHGDLSTRQHLVLTSRDYQELLSGDEFEAWRERLKSVFQMQPVVVVGYSLRDVHVRAVLEAAKRGATAYNPVCWVAPSVTRAEALEYLERYRIRVVPYPETDDHSGLTRVIETISTFVIPREGVRLRRSIASVVDQGRRGDSAATAIYVFNRLAPHLDVKRLRADVALASFEAAIPSMANRGPFTVEAALAEVGWPEDATDPGLANEVARRAVQKRYVRRIGDALEATQDRTALDEHRAQYEHIRARFLHSTELRIRRECSWIDEAAGQRIALDIDASLTGFFRRGGLTLASVLTTRAGPGDRSVPASVIAFVTEASAQYETMPERLAFWRGTIGAFTNATDAERAYLGRLAQGFFAFHALGMFGEAALEQVRNARDTTWLVDSSLQIPAVAVGSPSNAAYAEIFRRLAAARIRMFTTNKLFNETFTHLRFAIDIINRFGSDSHNAIAAARGDPPYWKQNLFLEGFIEWKGAGNPDDWPAYLHATIGSRDPEPRHLVDRLRTLGIEVIDFQDWPGFDRTDFAIREDFESSLKALMWRHRAPDPDGEASFERWLEEKVPPEAEAAVIVLRERGGQFNVISDAGAMSPAWFISATSVINALGDGLPITWQPEAFLAFAGTLVPSTDAASSDRAFEIVLSSIAEAGLSPISEDTIAEIFGSVIDQAAVELADQREALVKTLGDRYGEKPEDVLKRIPPSRRLIATIQMSMELVDTQTEQLRVAQATGVEASRRAKKAESELEGVARLRRNLAERKQREQQRQRRAATRPSKRRKK